MNENNVQEFSDLMDATMPIYRMEASKPTKKIWWNILLAYEFKDVANAFADHLRTNKFAPTPADIVDCIDRMYPDGRPGADEAWAMYPHDELASAVVTEEMHQAMYFASDIQDQVAARMAFKEAYTRIVSTNKRAGIAPQWVATLGHEVDGRAPALAEAVRLGRIGAQMAIGMIPPDDIFPMLEMAGETRLALEYKPVSDEKALENIARIKEMLSGSRIGSVKFIDEGRAPERVNNA